MSITTGLRDIIGYEMTQENGLRNRAHSRLSTPLIADACLRLKAQLRIATSGIRPVVPSMRATGRVLPARHRGSVDVFLEAMMHAKGGDILVVDNEDRKDEACIGDLTVLEARAHGLAGLVVRGLHRDTLELVEIGFPVFSYGTCPAGPRRLDQRQPHDLSSAQWNGFTVDSNDFVFADDDGVVFVEANKLQPVLETAESIWKIEREQAKRITAGRKLTEQLAFSEYLAKRSSDASFTFRKHLREREGAIEE